MLTRVCIPLRLFLLLRGDVNTMLRYNEVVISDDCTLYSVQYTKYERGEDKQLTFEKELSGTFVSHKTICKRFHLK